MTEIPDPRKPYPYSLQYKINTRYGVQHFLLKHGADVSGKGRKLNRILVDFLSHKGIYFKRWHSKYRGDFNSDLHNSITVSFHWVDFRKWFHENKHKYVQKT